MSQQLNEESSGVSQAFPYQVKIEPTAKGLRVHVHVYTKDIKSAEEESVALYMATKANLAGKGETIAPTSDSK